MEDQEINPHSYSHLIFNTGIKNICWRKYSLFNKCCWENWILTCRRLSFTMYKIISKKWIKLLMYNMKLWNYYKETLQDIKIGNCFLTRTPNAQLIRSLIDKQDYIKLKSCTPRKTTNRFNRQPTVWEKIFSSNSIDKRLYSEYIKSFKNQTPKNKWSN
jgi:hypothetical protein